MGQLRDRMYQDLQLKKYSASTRRVYLLYARRFVAHYQRNPSELGAEEIREYLLHLMEVKQVSHTTYRQNHAALKFLYTVTLGRPWEVERIPFPKRHRTLPTVLSAEQVNSLLKSIRAPKYRALLMATYAGGLRIAEACRLRIGDIDSGRGVIWVRGGKGGHDRCTVLSGRLLLILREYWKIARPSDWLFPGRTKAGHISTGAVRIVFRQACKEAGIAQRCSPHTLRHSFATHLLDDGTDIKVIQALLGHRSIESTSIYTHVTVKHIQKVRSPLEQLAVASAPDV